jgi:hypothetical protein
MRVRLFAGAGLAIVLAAIIAGFLAVRVCDEQLAATGAVVTVCRHMAATDPPVLVLGMVALVLLSVFYAEISGFGFTLRRKVEELENRSDALQKDVAALTGRYDTLRETMPGGAERTRLMTELFKQLKETLRDTKDFDLAGHLRHDERRERLAAYAYLRTHTVPDVMSSLVRAATSEDTPFGQYAALRAALHQRDSGVPLAAGDRAALVEARVPGTDRARLIDDLLS